MQLLLPIAVLIPVTLVVVSIFMVLWRERTSERGTWVALTSGIVLAVWAIVNTVLSYQGMYHTATSFPPIGINLIIVLLVLALSLIVSRTLRGLLTRQSSLIRLHVWRLEGIVFLILMLLGQLPALWALPAGIGDVLIGVTAFSVARGVETPQGKRRAIFWNLFGMFDLIVAVTLGVTTNPGPAQIFHTTPMSELLTQFPLALVPTFLVPLAFTLHVISLWQLLGGTWARQPSAAN